MDYDAVHLRRVCSKLIFAVIFIGKIEESISMLLVFSKVYLWVMMEAGGYGLKNEKRKS
jgi:hypothetical protein